MNEHKSQAREKHPEEKSGAIQQSEQARKA